MYALSGFISKSAIVLNALAVFAPFVFLLYARVLLVLDLDNSIKRGTTFNLAFWFTVGTALGVLTLPSLNIVIDSSLRLTLCVFSLLFLAMVSIITFVLYYRGKSNEQAEININ